MFAAPLVEMPLKLLSLMFRSLFALFCWKPLACTVGLVAFWAGMRFAAPPVPLEEAPATAVVRKEARPRAVKALARQESAPAAVRRIRVAPIYISTAVEEL